MRQYKYDMGFTVGSTALPDLTSFSILMARWKGFLDAALHGAAALDDIQEGDEILIAEGCTHHRQCEDIGTVKLPKWICNYTGVTPKFTFTGIDPRTFNTTYTGDYYVGDRTGDALYYLEEKDDIAQFSLKLKFIEY